MYKSTITVKGQTTIPLDIRKSLIYQQVIILSIIQMITTQ